MPRNRSVSHSASRSRSREVRRRPARRSPSPQGNNNQNEVSNQEPKLFVGGLDVDVQADDLRSLFQTQGDIDDCFVIRKETFAFAFVTFGNMKDAENAMQKYNGEELRGKRMKINLAKPRPPRDNSSRPSGCFKCGGEGHMARQCTNANESQRQDRPPRERGSGGGSGCFKCGESGHFARECPNPNANGGGNGRRETKRSPSNSSTRQEKPRRPRKRSVSRSNSR